MFTFALIILTVIAAAEFVAVFTPLVVFATTEIVKIVLPKLQGWKILTIVVPVMSLFVTLIANFIADPGLSFWAQFGYGLLAVFVNEFMKQIKGKAA